MGLFGMSYNKPGKGVEKDEREKHRFFVFFEVFFRKFLKFVQLNVLYVLFSLPYLALLYWFSPINTQLLSGVSMQGIGEYITAMPLADRLDFDVVLRLMFAFGVLTFWGAGPISAGFGYVIRNFSRQEHAWVWGDFWDNIKENFKSGMAVLAVDILMLFLTTTAFQFYSIQYSITQNSMLLVLEGFLAVVLLLYTFMHSYIFQLMVTFDDKLVSLYRNSFIFAIAKFPQNLFFTLIAAVLFFVFFFAFSLGAALLGLIISVALIDYIILFYTSEVVRLTAEQTKSK